VGADCDGVPFFDSLHLAQGAHRDFGLAAHAAFREADGERVRRVLTFGDPLRATGALFDTTLRVTGVGVPPSPPYFEMRFSNGPITIDVFEQAVRAKMPPRFFAQPFRAALVASASGTQGPLTGSLDLQATYFVPKSLPVETEHRTGSIRLSFESTPSVHTSRGGTAFELQACNAGVKAGDRIPARTVTLRATPGVGDSITLELLFYRLKPHVLSRRTCAGPRTPSGSHFPPVHLQLGCG